MRIRPLLALMSPALFPGAPSAVVASEPCDQVDDIRSTCGLAAPEDLYTDSCVGGRSIRLPMPGAASA